MNRVTNAVQIFLCACDSCDSIFMDWRTLENTMCKLLNRIQDMIWWSNWLGLNAFNLAVDSLRLNYSSLTFNSEVSCVGEQNSVKKLPVLPSGVSLFSLEILQRCGIDNLRVAVGSSCLQVWRKTKCWRRLVQHLSFFSLYLFRKIVCLNVYETSHNEDTHRVCSSPDKLLSDSLWENWPYKTCKLRNK